MQFQTQNNTQEAQNTAYILENTMKSIEDEQALSSTIISSLLEEFTELLESHGIDTDELSNVDIQSLEKAAMGYKDDLPALAQEIFTRFQGIQATLQKAIAQHQSKHPQSQSAYLSGENPFTVMADIMAQVNQKMQESQSKFAQIDSQMLQDEFNQEMDDYKKAEKQHGFLHHFVKDLTYIGQGLTCVALALTGNIAAAAAVFILSLAMDTGMLNKAENCAENHGMDPLVAKAMVACVVAVACVATAGAADMALAADVTEEAGTVLAEEAGTELTTFAEEEGGSVLESEVSSESEAVVEKEVESTVEEKVETKVEDKTEKKAQKSLAKTLVGVGVMSASTALVQDNFAVSVAKHIDNKVLRDVVGSLLLITELAGAVAGGGVAFTSGADAETAVNNLSRLSELTSGALGGEAESMEEFNEMLQNGLNKLNAIDKGLGGIFDGLRGGNQIHIGKLYEQIQELNTAQQITRNSIREIPKFSKEVASSFAQLFESLDFGVAAQTVANILGNES